MEPNMDYKPMEKKPMNFVMKHTSVKCGGRRK